MAAAGLFFWQPSSLSIIWVLSCWKEDELVVNKCLFLLALLPSLQNTPSSRAQVPVSALEKSFSKTYTSCFFLSQAISKETLQAWPRHCGLWRAEFVVLHFLLSISKKRRKEGKKKTY